MCGGKRTALWQVDEAAVWSELGHAQLEAGAVGDAIASYLKAGDSSRHADVIRRSQQAGSFADLVRFLLMVRKKVKDSKVCCRCVSLSTRP